jgi:hypothetical protein
MSSNNNKPVMRSVRRTMRRRSEGRGWLGFISERVPTSCAAGTRHGLTLTTVFRLFWEKS